MTSFLGSNINWRSTHLKTAEVFFCPLALIVNILNQLIIRNLKEYDNHILKNTCFHVGVFPNETELTVFKLCTQFHICSRKKKADGNKPCPACTAVRPSCPGRSWCHSLSPSLQSILHPLGPKSNTSHLVQETYSHALWEVCIYRT